MPTQGVKPDWTIPAEPVMIMAKVDDGKKGEHEQRLGAIHQRETGGLRLRIALLMGIGMEHSSPTGPCSVAHVRFDGAELSWCPEHVNRGVSRSTRRRAGATCNSAPRCLKWIARLVSRRNWPMNRRGPFVCGSHDVPAHSPLFKIGDSNVRCY